MVQAAAPPADPARMYVWLKGVETKVNTLLREVDILKNDALRKNGDLRRENKALAADLLELRREQEQLQQKMDLVVKELKQTAGADEVNVLKKYLDFWNPLHFVTQRDLALRQETHKNEIDLPFH